MTDREQHKPNRKAHRRPSIQGRTRRIRRESLRSWDRSRQRDEPGELFPLLPRTRTRNRDRNQRSGNRNRMRYIADAHPQSSTSTSSTSTSTSPNAVTEGRPKFSGNTNLPKQRI